MLWESLLCEPKNWASGAIVITVHDSDFINGRQLASLLLTFNVMNVASQNRSLCVSYEELPRKAKAHAIEQEENADSRLSTNTRRISRTTIN
jgi:hypothetical protein